MVVFIVKSNLHLANVIVTMRIEYSKTEFKVGTTVARIHLYEDDGDVIMTDGILYDDDDESA